jgi:hypothetical protein
VFELLTLPKFAFNILILLQQFSAVYYISRAVKFPYVFLSVTEYIKFTPINIQIACCPPISKFVLRENKFHKWVSKIKVGLKQTYSTVNKIRTERDGSDNFYTVSKIGTGTDGSEGDGLFDN